MAFKLFILCLGLLAVTVSASSLCKCGPEKKDSVAKYTLKISSNGTDYDEQVEVDKEKETETFHVAKTSPERDSGDIIYDFKKNLSMIRLIEAKACFLSNLTSDVPRPADMLKLLDSANRNGDVKVANMGTEEKLKVVSTLEDRSDLSDEMANMCAKLPIYEVAEGEVDPSTLNKTTTEVVETPDQPPAKRIKRGLVRTLVCSIVCRISCGYVCSRVCVGWSCYRICRPACVTVCHRVCHWVWKWIG